MRKMTEVNFIPEYKGSVEIFDGFIINLIKMPTKIHQRNMEETFGWKFQEGNVDSPLGKDVPYSERKLVQADADVERAKWCVFCRASPEFCKCDDTDGRIRWAVWAHMIPRTSPKKARDVDSPSKLVDYDVADGNIEVEE